jgi:hypothetical protein
MKSKPLHILMAMVMAFWSPAWCQCVLLAAAQGQAHGAAALITVEPLQEDATPACSHDHCCPDETPDPEPPASSSDCCPGTHDLSGTCDCSCCDQGGTGALSTTAASAAALLLATSFPLAEPLLAAVAVREPPPPICDSAYAHAPPLQATQNLHARGCLLLI